MLINISCRIDFKNLQFIYNFLSIASNIRKSITWTVCSLLILLLFAGFLFKDSIASKQSQFSEFILDELTKIPIVGTFLV